MARFSRQIATFKRAFQFPGKNSLIFLSNRNVLKPPFNLPEFYFIILVTCTDFCFETFLQCMMSSQRGDLHLG